MALFKISKGASRNLSKQTKVEGYCWYSTDDHLFHIDVSSSDRQVLFAGGLISPTYKYNESGEYLLKFENGVPALSSATIGGDDTPVYLQAGRITPCAGPLKLDITGNASTADLFKTAKSIALDGDITGSASSTGGWSITTTLANSGVTAGEYGPQGNLTPAHEGNFIVPQITVDAKGRVTKVIDRSVTLPADKDTTYSAGTGISFSGTTINHKNSVTAGTASGDATKTLTWGGTFTIPSITYDAQGHITGKSTTTMTMPANPINGLSSTYVLKAGDTMTGNLTLPTLTISSTSGVSHIKLSRITSYNYIHLPIASGGGGVIAFCVNSSVGASESQMVVGETSIIPGTTNAIALGTSTKKWSTIYGTKVYGAVWNDYAEFRTSDCQEPGRVICENGDDTLSLATKRLQPAGNVISDTFGFAIGETETAKTPIAVSGRVLVYPYEDRYSYNPGDAVCAAPGGTVSKMTREEIITYPERIIGTVSAIPDYETWGEGNVPVNGRIWIKVK